MKDKNDRIIKFASVTAATPGEAALECINRHTLTPLGEEQVFCFSVNACDDQLDRQNEHFTVEALSELATLYVGKTVIFDHNWSAKNQCGRIYAAEVVADGGVHRLRLDCYMLRNDETKAVIAAIEGGILKEVSVGCSCTAVCDICGEDYWGGECRHISGRSYGGKVCTVTLSHATDAYEVSFVAVPAQKEAGVTKQLDDPEPSDEDKKKAFVRLEAERLKIEADEINNF